MHYTLLFSLLLVLTACNPLQQQTTDIADTPIREISIDERREWQVRSILGQFWIEDYMPTTESQNVSDFLSSSMLSCEWKEYIEYRNCMISKLESWRAQEIHTSRTDELARILIQSLKEEIDLKDIYTVVDGAPYLPMQYTGESNKCHIITSKDIREPWSEYGKWIILSYLDTYSWSIEIIKEPETVYLPQWDLLRNNGWTEEFRWHENPCIGATFGPDAGNIFYTWRTDTLQFFWIKDVDGGGSGEFSYTIFAHPIGSREFRPIGQFFAWSGIVPFVQDINTGGGTSRVQHSIITKKKNEAFLYTMYTENKRTGVIDTLKEILTTYIR